MHINRREFLGAMSAAGAAAGLGVGGGFGLSLAAESADAPLGTPPTTRRGDMIYRKLGRMGEEVSAIGLGGAHIGKGMSPEDSVRLIRRAIDGGVTFMDNCWDYNDGASEERMGLALADGYRDKVFLMTKIDGRDKPTAARQIDESLRRLRTDRVDLMQFHEVIRPDDPDRFFAEGGALEALREARQAGKIRHIGFTGHKDPFIHLRMLEMAREREFRFDAVQMPLNVMDAHFRSFERQVLPVLVREGIAVLGMKALGNGVILDSGVVTAIECLHYALSLPAAVVITGVDKPEILAQAFEAARTFQPLTAARVKELLGRTRQLAMTGKYEVFKTTMQLDGTVKHPEWMGEIA